MNVAFDVDGTLLNFKGSPRQDIVNMLVTLSKYANVFVWSGGGLDYAEYTGRRLKLPSNVRYVPKTTDIHMDITFDDMMVTLGDKNITV